MKKIERTKELLSQIEYKYYKELKSVTMIANELNVGRETIRQILIQDLHGVRNQKEAGEIRGSDKRGYSDIEEKTKRMRKGFQTQLTEGKIKEKLSIKKQGEKNEQAKLTEEKVREIRGKYEEYQSKYGLKKRETQFKLGFEYGVSRQTISSIVTKRTWKHIE